MLTFSLTKLCARLALAGCVAAGLASHTLSAQAAEQNVTEQVRAFIAAGELGAAADAAAQAEPAQQAELLQEVISAQVKIGNPQGALGIATRLGGQDRGHAQAEVAQEQSLAGGFGADFQSLIDLIQEHTAGPWFDIDGIGGTIGEFESGIRVDPHGVLYRAARQDTTGRLDQLGINARQAYLNTELAQVSGLRLVSLSRLEREVAERLAQGNPVVDSMQQLAGLTRIQYVFVLPDERDIVIGGPAEGWVYNEFGMAVGSESGRPVLQLDDLVTVLRTFSNHGRQQFGCSIDPRAENLKAVQEFATASQAKGPLSAGSVRGWANQLGEILGRQDITIYGVPANSRVARVLVEADYRMKLIGIGKLDGGSHVPDYFELLKKNPGLATGSLDALRWWLTMNYEQVLHTADRNTFEISGGTVRCQSENQFLTENGDRVNSGKAEPVNQQFAANFTQHYAELAQQDPIFADLQGVFDLALTAALIDREEMGTRAGWNGGVFAAQGAYHPKTYYVPREVDTVVNHRVFGGRDIVVQVAGGVRADIAGILTNETVRPSEELAKVAVNATPSSLPANRWWWDAK